MSNPNSVKLTKALIAWRTANSSQQQYERALRRLNMSVQELSGPDRDRYGKITMGQDIDKRKTNAFSSKGKEAQQ